MAHHSFGRGSRGDASKKTRSQVDIFVTALLALSFSVVGQAQFSSASSPTVSKTESKQEDRVLWDHWYTVTVNGKVHFAYYQEKVEIKGGRVHYQNHLWKKEEGYVNEEHLGAFAKADETLTPLFYNFYSRYRDFETHIDGSVDNGKLLKVKVREGEKERPLIKHRIRKKTFFSSMFPVWLGLKIKQYKVGTKGDILTIPEDDIQASFSPNHGKVTFSEPDEFAKANQAHRIDVLYSYRKSTWWIDSQGAVLRAELHKGTTVIEKVTEKVAKAFLLEKDSE